MTDRLLTEQEIQDAVGSKMAVCPHHRRMLLAQDAKSVAACNQEWQEKIKTGIDEEKSRKAFGWEFVVQKMERLMRL